MLAQTPAQSSDWVEDGRTNFQLPPHPLSLPILPNDAPPGIPTVGVTDPGSVGQSEQPVIKSSALQGNVQEQRLPSFPPMNFPQVSQTSILPVLVPPATRVVPPKVYSGWLKETHPQLGPMTKESVVEIKGQWDNSAHALHSFGFSSTTISPGALSKTSLAGTNLLLVDCAGEIPQAGLAVINKFVKGGGWLITTDWALDNCLARAIPGFVSWNGGYSSSEIIDARLNPNASPELTQNTFNKAVYWKLDDKCQTVKVIKPKEVEVIAYSNRLAREDPDGHGILAFTFKYGEGRVLHLVGHFDHNTNLTFNNSLPDPSPRIGISLRQAIAANFIAASLEAHPRPAADKK